ncbi:MAG: hypothetical protein ACRDKW_05450 [Actinomycetota bacterium]
MQLLTGPKVWATIAELAAGSKRSRAAVGRLAAGASELLRLPEGSSLVVDLSPYALAQGQTNPDEVGRYLDAGVSVFTWTGMNANVFLFDRTAVVGSAGVSQRSARGLTEAAFLTRDADVVSNLRSFLDSVSKVPVTARDLDQAREEFRPAPSPPRENDNPITYDLIPTEPYRLWVCEYADRPWPKRVYETFEAEEPIMSLRLGDRRRYVLYTFLLWGPWAGRVGVGDVLLCAWHDDPEAAAPQGIWPPAHVIGATVVRGRGEEGVIVYAKYARTLEPVPWEEYRSKVAEAGLRFRLPVSRPVKASEEQAVLLSPWGLAGG